MIDGVLQAVDRVLLENGIANPELAIKIADAARSAIVRESIQRNNSLFQYNARQCIVCGDEASHGNLPCPQMKVT